MDKPRPEGSSAAAPPLPEPFDEERLRELKERAQRAMAEQREQASRLEERVAEEIDRLSDELAEAFASQSDEAATLAENRVAEERAAFEAERVEWEQLRDEIEANLESLRVSLQEQATKQQQQRQDLADGAAAQDEKRQELARWAAELADERQQLEALRRDVGNDGEGDAAPREAAAAWEQERRSLVAERDALAAERDALAIDRDALVDAVAAARRQLEANEEALAEAAASSQAAESHQVAESNQAAEALRSLEEKFALALDDVQQQRLRIAELEQELAGRPPADANESLELARLRNEHDELTRELETLRARPNGGAPDQAPDEAAVDELRRRFEMAVEDVRQLKTEKAELEQQLADAAEAPAASPDGHGSGNGGNDWESQKRRMLASLQGDEAPAEDRATIEGTIRITDEVLAEKQTRIEQLEAALAAGEGAPVDAVVLDDDPRFEAERVRLAELEQAWEEKLRAAELELSVERAKLARSKAELDELRADLDSRQRTLGGRSPAPEGGDAAGGQRNWLNKLGLGGGDS